MQSQYKNWRPPPTFQKEKCTCLVSILIVSIIHSSISTPSFFPPPFCSCQISTISHQNLSQPQKEINLNETGCLTPHVIKTEIQRIHIVQARIWKCNFIQITIIFIHERCLYYIKCNFSQTFSSCSNASSQFDIFTKMQFDKLSN